MATFKVITAVHLLLTDDQGKLLLARRYNTGYEDGNYSVIAGHVEEGETIKQAMCREALEEGGIEIKEKDLEFVHVMYRCREASHRSDRIDFFFKAEQWQGVPQIMEVDKCDEMGWYRADEIPVNTIGYVKSAIQKYQSTNFSEYGW